MLLFPSYLEDSNECGAASVSFLLEFNTALPQQPRLRCSLFDVRMRHKQVHVVRVISDQTSDCLLTDSICSVCYIENSLVNKVRQLLIHFGHYLDIKLLQRNYAKDIRFEVENVQYMASHTQAPEKTEHTMLTKQKKTQVKDNF